MSDGFGPPGEPVPRDPQPAPVPGTAPGTTPSPVPVPPAATGPVPVAPVGLPAPGALTPQAFAAVPYGPREAWLPRPYPQLLRGPNFRWWRVPASVGVLLGVTVAGFVALAVGAAIAGAVLGIVGVRMPDLGDELADTGPLGLLFTNLVLAALIPLVQAATWVSYRWRPRWVSSVEGGIRWGWLLRCWAVVVPVFGVLFAGSVVVLEDVRIDPEPRWALLALVILLTTPLQAAGEEYLCRGWMQQTVGSAFARPVVGAVVAALVSSGVFALLHGQQNPWLFGDRFAFGLLACWLVWRTGGLEAGIALHGVNNLAVFAYTIATGSLADTLTATSAGATDVLVDAVVVLPTVAAVWFAARRWPPRRLFTPPVTVAA